MLQLPGEYYKKRCGLLGWLYALAKRRTGKLCGEESRWLAGTIMARYRRGKMALYEVMSKARIKPSYGQTLEKLRAEAQAHLSDLLERLNVLQIGRASCRERV